MMKQLCSLKNAIALLTIVFVAWSCNDDDNSNDTARTQNDKNIVQTADSQDMLSSLVAAINTADNSEGTAIAGTLSGEGPFTVFAPTNAAFTALLEQLDGFESLADFDTDADRKILTTILTYHVVDGVAAKSTDLTEGQTVTTIQGENLTISLAGGVFIKDKQGDDVDPAKVITADVIASNGVVHVIDKILLPKATIDALNGGGMTDEKGTLVDVVVATEKLSILEAAVLKADLAATLSSEGPFTVFAPTNDAFVALLDVLGDDFKSLDDFDQPEEIALLKDILLYHVVSGATVLAADLKAGDVATALENNSISVIASGDSFVIGDASETDAIITGTDIMASNGVAHTINKVLLPQSALDFVASLSLKSIVDIAVATDDLSLLVDALKQADAGLVETLSGDGPFTVFAPTNAAFANLLELLGDDYNSLADFDTEVEKGLLVKVLTYHVVSAKALAGDLSDNQKIKTLQGEDVSISLTDGKVLINDATEDSATVTTADVVASNGVVHIIDKVLIPQEVLDILSSLSLRSIVEIATATNDLSILVSALQQADAGMVETLQGDGPFTVFAPTNDAFMALLNDLGDDYNKISDFDTPEEKEFLTMVLQYHVIIGVTALSSSLTDGQTIRTAQGEHVGISIKNGTVHITDATENNATVIAADVLATNGVVHVINKVLLPQEVLDILNPPTPNIVQKAQSVGDLSALVAALIQADAGLVETLSGDGPFTVFAPSNAAFGDLLDALGDDYHSLDDFNTEMEKALLARVLTYHVVAGAAVASTALTDHQELVTVQGESLFAILAHGVQIRDKSAVDATVTTPDVVASNGIVHVIDKVLQTQEIVDLLNPGH